MSNNINLEKNGRIFPSWVMQNFKKYILPEIINKPGDDPCNIMTKRELTDYQKFIGMYLNYQSPFKDLLIYHGVGAGKTNTVINIYNLLYNFTPKWNIFILIPASLHDDPWLKDLNNWMNKDDFDKRLANIIFIHYDSPIADRDFLDKVRQADSSKNTVFIIDEMHRFISNVYGNIYSKKGKRAQTIYDYIVQEKKSNDNIRIMLLSATPVLNKPFEFALIFNLLRPGTFPESESIFEQMFISSTNFASLNENTKNMFQRRILGLVSYYIGATPDKYASKTVHFINIPMINHHLEVYTIFEEIEEKKEEIRRKMSRGKVNDDMSTYASYTRQGCNFVFPNIDNNIMGEKRPRPGQFRIKQKDIKIVNEGARSKSHEKLVKNKDEVIEYLKAIRKYVNGFIIYLKDILREDIKNNRTLADDVKDFHAIYKNDFNI